MYTQAISAQYEVRPRPDRSGMVNPACDIFYVTRYEDGETEYRATSWRELSRKDAQRITGELNSSLEES